MRRLKGYNGVGGGTGVDDLLGVTRLRIRMIWFAATAFWLAPFIGVAILLSVAAVWLTGVALPWWVPVAAAAATVGLVVVAARMMSVSDHDAARVLERRADLDDVLTSALEFGEPDDPFHQAIRARAAESADLNVASVLPVRGRPKRGALMVAAVLGATALTLVDPLGSDPVRAAELSALDQEAARLEELAEEIRESAEAADDEEDEAALAELADLVEKLAAEVESAESPEEAALALEQGQQELTERAGDSFLAEKAAVLGLEQSLALRPLAPGGSAGEQFEALAGQLDSLSALERAAAADRLEALAATQAEGNAAVADALDDAAGQLREGALPGAADALRRAAARQQAALGRLTTGQASLSAGQAAASAAARLGTAASGQGQGEGEGAGQGQGAGQGAGQGGNGGQPGNGAAGQISGVSPTGQNPSGQGGVGTPGAGPQAEVTTDVATATVFDPIRGGPVDEQQVGIEGGTGEGDLLGTGLGPTARGQALVPYVDVLPDYLNDAADALDQMEIPPSLRTSIRDYFDNLAEGR